MSQIGYLSAPRHLAQDPEMFMPQHELILHHYSMSPFAEKVRVAFGIKGLAWRSVKTAPQPPRPELTALTGGYRRIPVLQVGANVYCDTSVILPALDRLAGGPTLYPAETKGLAPALSFNFERASWRAIIGVAVHFMKDTLPDEFLRDRKDDYLYFDMSKSAMEPEYARNLQLIHAQLAWVVEALSGGRRFLAGEAPGALDLAYFHPLWFIRAQGPTVEIDRALGIEPIVPWFERVAAIDHGTPTEMTVEAALAAAREAAPAPVSHVSGSDPGDPKPGAHVVVKPDDFARAPVEGTLVAADAHEIVVHRTDPHAGDLHVHFPRAGFELKAA